MDEKLIKAKEGYVKVFRCLLLSGIWLKPAEYLKIFLYILCKVNHNDGLFQRGSNFFNFKDEVKNIPRVNINQIYNFLRWAKSKNVDILTTKNTTRGVIIKLNNYNYWQDLDPSKLRTILPISSNPEVDQIPDDKQEHEKRNNEINIPQGFLKFGKLQNVILTQNMHDKFAYAIVLHKEKANEIIDELSAKLTSEPENYKQFNEKYPDRHLGYLVTFWQNKKAPRKKVTTQSSVNKESDGWTL